MKTWSRPFVVVAGMVGALVSINCGGDVAAPSGVAVAALTAEYDGGPADMSPTSPPDASVCPASPSDDQVNAALASGGTPPPSQANACSILAGVATCKLPYIPITHDCDDFANHFLPNCQAAGLNCYVFAYGCGTAGHQVNIIQVANPAGGCNVKYCGVEPQPSGTPPQATIIPGTCWVQAPGAPSVPDFVGPAFCSHFNVGPPPMRIIAPPQTTPRPDPTEQTSCQCDCVDPYPEDGGITQAY